MKNLAAQALTFQYKLQLENAKNTINNDSTPLNEVDKALGDIFTATTKLRLLKELVDSSTKKVEPKEEKKDKT
jgi:hypothetical protein